MMVDWRAGETEALVVAVMRFCVIRSGTEKAQFPLLLFKAFMLKAKEEFDAWEGRI